VDESQAHSPLFFLNHTLRRVSDLQEAIDEISPVLCKAHQVIEGLKQPFCSINFLAAVHVNRFFHPSLYREKTVFRLRKSFLHAESTSQRTALVLIIS
jgi:hypothetical protein